MTRETMYFTAVFFNGILIHWAAYCYLNHTSNFQNSFSLKKNQNTPKLGSQSYVTSISQLLTNLFDTSTTPVLGKLCQIAAYGEL